MAGTIVSMPDAGAADWSSFVTIVEKTYRGYMGVSLSEFDTSAEPAVLDGSVIEISGSIYQFATAEAITGWPSAGGTAMYIAVVPSGTTATIVFTASAPTWSNTKDGWYDGNDRYLGGLYWGGSATYSNKWIYGRHNDNIDNVIIYADGGLKILKRLLHIQDEKASGTQGGTFTEGAWRKRDLGPVKTNEISGASLANSQITLPAGTYYVEWSAPVFKVNRHKTILYNVTDTSVIILGTSESAASAGEVGNSSFGSGRFTLAAEKVLELRHRCLTTALTNGFGVAGSYETEVYSIIKIWKID